MEDDTTSSTNGEFELLPGIDLFLWMRVLLAVLALAMVAVVVSLL